jgi:hypothetical protein
MFPVVALLPISVEVLPAAERTEDRKPILCQRSGGMDSSTNSTLLSSMIVLPYFTFNKTF